MKDARRRAGRPGRAAHVGVDLPLDVLAHPAARGPGARLPVVVLHLRPGRRRPPGRLRAARPRPRPEALPATPAARSDLGAEERAGLVGAGRRPGVHAAGEADRRRVPRVPAPAAGGVRARLRRSTGADGAPLPRPRRRPGAVELAIPPRFGRRVPGHQRRAVGAGADAHGGAPQRDGGRRPGSVDLQIPRGRLPEPPEVRGGVPRGDHHRHGAELPVEPAHPRRGQRGDRQQRGAPAQAPLDRADRWRAHHAVPRRGRARRGRVRRARDRSPGRHRALPLRRRRRLLPHQRAEPRDRGDAGARRGAVPRGRRREVLRPARGQGHPRVPAGAGEPRRRGQLAPRGEHAQARGRRHVGQQGVGVRAGRRHHVPRRAARGGRRGCHREGARRHQRPARAHVPVRGGRGARHLADGRGHPRADRVPRRARGRAVDRGPGPGREPPGARGRLPRVRSGARRR